MVEMLENPTMKETDARLAKFERFEKEAKQPSWIFRLRKAGIARFAELGFPTLKDEDWRFTNVAPIAKLPFEPVFETRRDGLSADAIARFTFGQATLTRLAMKARSRRSTPPFFRTALSFAFPRARLSKRRFFCCSSQQPGKRAPLRIHVI